MGSRLRGAMPLPLVGAVCSVLALAAVLVAPAAQATVSTTDVSYACTTSAFGITYKVSDRDYVVTVNVPASLQNGSQANVRWTFDEAPKNAGAALTGVSFTTDAHLVLERPGHTPSIVAAPTSAGTAAADLAPFADLPGPVSFVKSHLFTADDAGDVVTLKPGPLTFEVVAGEDDATGITVTCEPVGADADLVLASVTVNGAPEPCVETDTCIGDRTFVGDVPADALSASMQPDPESPWPTTIGFPGVVASASNTVLREPAHRFTRVSDTRTVAVGWTLTAEATDLTSQDGGSLPASALSIDQLSCGSPVGSYGSAPASAGAGGELDDPVTLCSVEPGDVGPTNAPGGQWDVVGRVSLDLPAFASSGVYTSTITLVLS